MDVEYTLTASLEGVRSGLLGWLIQFGGSAAYFLLEEMLVGICRFNFCIRTRTIFFITCFPRLSFCHSNILQTSISLLGRNRIRFPLKSIIQMPKWMKLQDCWRMEPLKTSPLLMLKFWILPSINKKGKTLISMREAIAVGNFS